MQSFTATRCALAVLAVLVLSGSTALAQHHGSQPAHRDEHAPGSKADQRLGDPYPLDTCPVSDKRLGSMGDPAIKLYDGREIRFCCPACFGKFEKDKAASLSKLDDRIVQDQGSLYPLKSSVVTGKDLPEKPYQFVYGNRLVRLGAESEKADFLKEPKKSLEELDKAAIAQQGKNYPLAKCPVSGDPYGGEMGKPLDIVIAGRLIRLCCDGCQKDLEKDPAKFIAVVDAARKGDKSKPDHDHKEKHDK